MNGSLTKLVTHNTWATGAGSMHTKRKCTLKFKLNKFSTSKEVEWKFYVDESELQETP